MSDPLAHGYDFSWAQIGGDQVKAGGGSFVVRYLGGNASLTPVERDNLHRDGVAILLIYETAADEAEHPERGRQDALNALAQARGLGYPDECALFFADDHNDPDVSQEVGYSQGTSTVETVPERGGMYSGGNVLDAVIGGGILRFGWGVGTWFSVGEDGNGNVVNPHPHAHLIQLANTKQPEIPGIDPGTYDTNLLYQPIPAWGPNGVVWLGGPAPAPIPQPSSKECDLLIRRTSDDHREAVTGTEVASFRSLAGMPAEQFVALDADEWDVFHAQLANAKAAGEAVPVIPTLAVALTGKVQPGGHATLKGTARPS